MPGHLTGIREEQLQRTHQRHVLTSVTLETALAEGTGSGLTEWGWAGEERGHRPARGRGSPARLRPTPRGLASAQVEDDDAGEHPEPDRDQQRPIRENELGRVAVLVGLV